MAGLTLRGVDFAYQRREQSHPVFEQLDMSFDEGTFTAVLGPSGCGKSTLLHLLAGLERPRGGEILVGGAAPRGPGPDRGIVFQDYSLFPWMTARRNISFCAMQAVKGLSRKAADARADEYLSLVGLGDKGSCYPSQLSGGMRQRVAIAKALAMDPAVLLFDEPFGALDPETRLRLQGLLERLWAEQSPHRTVVFVTHDIDEALYLADRILFLDGGAVRDTIPVPFPRPRAREMLLSPEACYFRKCCMRLFHESAVNACG